MTRVAGRGVPSLTSRLAGALLGVHAGDCLGATLEFTSWSEVRGRYPDGLREIVGGGALRWQAGQATDDTDLTRAVLLAYLRARPGQDVVRLAADNMLAWLDGDWPGREPARRPRTSAAPPGRAWIATAAAGIRGRRALGSGEAGNGSLMRCIPTALAVASRQRRISESIEISAITHDDERAVSACAAYNEIAASLVAGRAPDESVTAGLATARELGSTQVAEAITVGQDLRPAVLAASGEIPFTGGASGFVLDSLSLAVAAVLDRRPLADVLVDIARLGNDADTNAAIAGGLLGARDGAAAIPAAVGGIASVRCGVLRCRHDAGGRLAPARFLTRSS